MTSLLVMLSVDAIVCFLVGWLGSKLIYWLDR